ncbi:MAG: nuclear transport factor 2 family protein [Cytophagales bacterium]|nr:nuclear transport factor 2 family protein [Cytophagales bacterium]
MDTQTLAQTTILSEDQQAIKDLIDELFKAADDRKWGIAESTMANSVYVDYSALGGTVGFQSPEEIVSGWKAFLPGFDRTVHQVHNQAIWVAGDRASATFDAIAAHYLEAGSGENHWTVFVGYDTEFIKQDGKWRLARIDLSLYDQVGNSELPQAALAVMENGAANPLASASDATATVEKFFQALEATNFEALVNTLDDEVVQKMPLAPANFPEEIVGIEAMKSLYKGVMDYEQSYDRIYLPTSNPNTVIVKFNGQVTTGEGKPYNNAYVNIYMVKQGKITEIVEMFNLNILLSGWPGLKPESYSVHAAGASTTSGVTLEAVVFNSQGVNLKGHLFLPPNFDASKTYPAAIVTGSWTSVKEQMPDEYASLLARDGLITLTFDFTGFGESEGQPRQVEDYQLKIADIKAAVDFLTRHPSVNKDELSGLGVCASSGYMAHATAQDKRIKQLVLVAPWLHNPAIAKSIYDLRPGGTEGLLASSKAAKAKYESTGEMEYVLGASELDPLSAMYVPENAFDYYLDPAKAAGAKYDNRFAVSSWEPWLTFDGIAAGKEITQPVFIVHSESGAVPHGAKEFYDHLKGDKEIVWLNDFNQQQLYFEEAAVNAAMGEVVKYLSK